MRGACAVGTDQQLAAVGGGDLGDRVGQHLDVVGGRVRPGVPGTELRGEELLGVVAPHPERMESEGPLEGGRSVLLLTVRDHDRGVDIEHDQVVAQVGAGDPAGRDTAGTTGTRRGDGPEPARSAIFFNRPGVTASSVRHTVGGDATGPSTPDWWRSTSMSTIASPPSASITATSVSTRPRSWTGDEVATHHRPGQLGGEPGPVGQKPSCDAARVRHHADTIGRERTNQTTTKYASLTECFLLGDLGP